jgi:hypothetical protein
MVFGLLPLFATAQPLTVGGSSVADAPLIGPLPERVIDSRLYLTGISRANQELRIYRDNLPVAETRSNDSGDFATAIALVPGRNTVEAVSVDFGRETDRSNVQIVDYLPIGGAQEKADGAGSVVTGTLPAPVLDAPTTPTTINPISVTGTATPGVTIRFFVNGVSAQTGVVSGAGTFSVHVPLEDGANAIYAIAEDGSDESSASNTVAVDYTNQVSRTQGGTLAQDTAWTRGDGTPYTVTSNVTVPAGVTLWIEPGATLKFGSNVKLLVQGALVIRGVASERVVLTSNQTTPTKGYWAGVEMTTATLVSIDYGQIEYAANGLYFHGSAASVGTVSNSLIQNNSRGVYILAPNASPTIASGNEITANSYGVYVQGNGTAAQNPLPVVTGNAIHDNVYSGSTIYDYYTYNFGSPSTTVLDATGNWWGTTDPAVIAAHIIDWTDGSTLPIVNFAGYLGSAGGSPVFTGPTLDGPINSNTTLSAEPYQVLGTVEVASGVTLTIPAGATLSVMGNYTLRIKGSLQVVGSAAQRVVFTSGKITPAKGDWAGIEITSTATTVSIDYAQIEYATYGLYFHGSSAGVGTVSHSLIQKNTRGIYVLAPNAAPTIASGNEITANSYGIYVQGNNTAAQNPLPVVTGNSIHDNVNSGSTIYDYYTLSFGNPGTTVLNATGNWWGTPVPAVVAVHIVDWTDGSTLPVVDYAGYLDSAGGSPVFTGPTLDGPISDDVTLSAQTYQVLGTVEVVAGVTLTIPAAAMLSFTSNYPLRIKGSLQVTGSSSQHTVFTSGKTTPMKGDWAGIEITSTATNVSIDYAQIEYAANGLYFHGSTAGVGTVSNSLIQNNSRGVYILAPNASPTIASGNEITANSYGIYVQGNGTAAQNPLPVVNGSSIHDNVNSGSTIYDYYTLSFGNPSTTVLDATGNWWGTTDAAVIALHIIDWTDGSTLPIVNFAGYLGSAGGPPVFTGPTLDGPINSNTTLSAQPYQVLGTVEVASGVTLTIPAGASLSVMGNYTLRIKGSLQVTGSAAQRVVFTSGRASPAKGNWAGIEITSTATNVSIDYAQIEYATYGLYFNGSVAGVGTVSHSLIQKNTRGIYVLAPNAAPTIASGNEVTANSYGIYVQGNNTAAQNPLPVVTGNSIHDNVNSGSTIYDYYTLSFGNPGTTVLNATGNWWGLTDYWQIASHINDWNDGTSLPHVGFEGYRNAVTDPPPTVVPYGLLINPSEVKPLQGVAAQGTFILTAPASLTTTIKRDSDGSTVFTHTDVYAAGGTYPFSWNGTDTSGNDVPVGLYHAVLVADDGTTVTTYDPPAPLTEGSVSGSVPSTYDPFRNVFWKINVTVASPSLLSLQATPSGGSMFSVFDHVFYPSGQSWVYWDGRDPSGQVLTQSVAMYFPAPTFMRSTALRVTGTQPTITGTGAAPNIEVKSNPYFIAHSYEEISTIVYRIDLDSYVTVKLLPPGIYDPGNAAAMTLVNNELQQARDGGGAPVDHSVEWRGYDAADTNHIVTPDEGVFTFTIEARSQQTNVSTLYRGVLQIRR